MASRSILGRACLAAGAAALCLCPLAQAQFFDDFESYTPGVICGQSGPPGGWEEWSSSVGFDVCGDVSTAQAFSGTQSLRIDTTGSQTFGDDTVQQFTINGGQWTFSTMMYFPTSATGLTWVILLNDYPAANWSMQVQFDADNVLVTNDPNFPGFGETIPMVIGQWAEFCVEIDLDNDLVNIHYDGTQFVTDQSWINGAGGGGLPQIRALDLYADEPPTGTNGTYFDDVSIQPGLGGCGGGGCVGDLNGDGSTDLTDLGILLADFGCMTPPGPCVGDLNGDGNTDLTDLGILLADFGCTP